ncbi:hypothetical protein RRG08_050390 [Elysia crispata]|uniref:Uncharacterized protein n=1 Tax=Elysia crispata TaxID=231223 RepID=A0AAE0YUJ7_9GAST|nr:hypothetical protein RRG08_050390 [Elysia crispata]
MYLKHTETLFLLGCTAFLSLYIVEADIISSSLSGSTQTIVEAFSQESKLPSQVTLDHTIEPTRAHEAKETVLIVGAGAGGAAAAVKLPLVSDARPGVEQAADAEQQAKFVPASSAESAEISQVL